MILKHFGKLPSFSEKFMILVIGVIRMSAQSLTSELGIGIKSHDLVGGFYNFEEFILRYRLKRR